MTLPLRPPRNGPERGGAAQAESSAARGPSRGEGAVGAGSRLGTPWARPGAQASAGKGRRPTKCFDLSDWSPLTMRIGRERGGGLYDSRDANYTRATSVNRPDFVFKGISRTLDPASLNMPG